MLADAACEYDNEREDFPAFIAGDILGREKPDDDPVLHQTTHVIVADVNFLAWFSVHEDSTPALYAVTFGAECEAAEFIDLASFVPPLEPHARGTGRGRLTALPDPTWEF